MAKKANEVKPGDIMSDIIVLRSVWGKAGQKYGIQPQRNRDGRYPSCVRRVDTNGDMILSDSDKELDPDTLVAENEIIVIADGTTFDLKNPREAARWEAIKDCFLIAPDRNAKDDAGNYLIDGSTDGNSGRFGQSSRYGRAELYIYRPGMEAKKRLSRKKLINKAYNFIENDEAGYEGWIRMAKVLGRNMSNLPAPDVQEFLMSEAEKNPERIINLYTGGDLAMRLLFVTAKEKGVIKKKGGVYFYGEDYDVTLGAGDDAVIEWMLNPRNKQTLDLIKKDSFNDIINK